MFHSSARGPFNAYNGGMFIPCRFRSLRPRRWILIAGVLATHCLFVFHVQAAEPEAIDFDRDIRPILSDNCFQCHGPDNATREADLRLDLQSSLTRSLEGGKLLVAGKPHSSLLYQRVMATDDTQMPPADSGKQLTAKEKQLLKRWIADGAAWSEHWSFVVPQRPPVPAVDSTWCNNAIDNFVLARMAAENLHPTSTADKVTLLRRITLDLTGLPPSIAEVDAFLADKSDKAYERVVDRLLDSPRFGEHMAAAWLDLARYADTSGYQNDGPRDMWRWRDWVINAYNQNMPFDQFTIEQIAGDLLQKNRGFYRGELQALELNRRDRNRLLATAFNRNHRGNAEGGIIPEEYQVEYVVDRLDTTATVWLGLTLGCARCHDHKYDPITQQEFYQVFAFFNNVPEYGRAIKEGNSPPFMLAPTDQQLAELQELRLHRQRIAKAPELHPDFLAKEQQKWEASVDRTELKDWSITAGLVAQFNFNGQLQNQQEDTSVARFQGKKVDFTQHLDGQAIQLSNGDHVNAGDIAKFGYFDPFTITTWVNPQSDGTLVSRMTMQPQGDGYYLHLENGHIQLNLVKRWLDDSIRVETKTQLPTKRWHHVAVTYDGSRVASGIKIYVDGDLQETVANHDFLNQSMAVEEPLRIGAGHSALAGQIDDVRIYERALTADEIAIVSVAKSVQDILQSRPSSRSVHERTKLKRFFVTQAAAAEIRNRQQQLDNLVRQEEELIRSFPTVMIMQESAQKRETFVLARGQYNAPQQAVQATIPAVFRTQGVTDRLSFARWLVARQNPLTARVTVNRFWQMLFGEGIVRTMEDFGSQGQRPSHPQLLDWLAVEFMENGWNVKQTLKTIALSATYQQSSVCPPTHLEQDPENRFLARQARFRMRAELVRDQALAASHLLYEQVGGPSVKPYQPRGLWSEIASDTNYEQSPPPQLYRRSLYTYWKRTVAPPTMTTFDATAREMCTVQRARTNTPLQALAIMNDTTYLEAARNLAGRALQQQTAVSDRIMLIVRSVLGRQATASELQILQRTLTKARARFVAEPKAATKLLSVGERPRDPELNTIDFAAYTVVASLILNLDETVTRE